MVVYYISMLSLDTYGPTPSHSPRPRHTLPHTHVHTQTARIAHTASLTRNTNVTRIPAIILRLTRMFGLILWNIGELFVYTRETPPHTRTMRAQSQRRFRVRVNPPRRFKNLTLTLWNIEGCTASLGVNFGLIGLFLSG